jgi:hypothetical protein
MPQIEKQQFKNQSGGHLGVTVITARGDDKGISVEPDGTVWLSEAEQRLTANAPRRPEDNPFIEQTLTRRSNETGELEEYTVTPLVAVSEDRFVPAEARPIPGDIPASRSPARAAAAVAAADALADVPPTPADTPADDVDLSGLATPEPEPVPEPVPAPVEPTPEPPAPEPTPEPQEAPVEPQTPPEETAGQVDPAVGEETGAATPPAGPAPEGEFAASEEVGTPVPPSAPAPWSPGSQG